MKKHNFFAGPAILPEEVKQQASRSILDFEGMGLSVMEISHRSPQWVSVMDKATTLVKDLLKVPEGYSVLFLGGGASSQFYMTAMNLLGQNDKAGYIDTGTWSAKAIKEAKLFGEVEVVASSQDKKYSYIPKEYTIADDIKYLHYTSNNTVYGTQFSKIPNVDVPLVADMSSDIFSRPVDVRKYDIIYCGAQKNMGPSGVTLVLVKNNAIGKSGRKLTSMLDYQTHINKDSMFNTPPVLPIYISMLTMQWVKDNGGVDAMEKRNRSKSELLYKEIKANEMFEMLVADEDRSQMNACFRLKNEGLEELLLNMAKDAGIYGIKGHRSVGGFRASMYNAMDIESVEVLVDVMKTFTKLHG